MGKRAGGPDKGQEVWGRAKHGPQGSKKGCTSRKEALFIKIEPLAPRLAHGPCFFAKRKECIKGALSLLLCLQFCMWVGPRDCSLCPLLPCVICFAGVLLKDGALLAGKDSYLAKIPLSFSLLGYNLLSMYYIMLIYVL